MGRKKVTIFTKKRVFINTFYEGWRMIQMVSLFADGIKVFDINRSMRGCQGLDRILVTM